mgnify:CR=1 FL=1
MIRHYGQVVLDMLKNYFCWAKKELETIYMLKVLTFFVDSHLKFLNLKLAHLTINFDKINLNSIEGGGGGDVFLPCLCFDLFIGKIMLAFFLFFQ